MWDMKIKKGNKGNNKKEIEDQIKETAHKLLDSFQIDNYKGFLKTRLSSISMGFSEEELNELVENEIDSLMKKCLDKTYAILSKKVLLDLSKFFKTPGGKAFLDVMPQFLEELGNTIGEWQQTFVKHIEDEASANYWKAQAEKGIDVVGYIPPIDLHLYWR